MELLEIGTTPKAGPLLVDGTISFAIRASFAKSGEKKASRAKAGITIAVGEKEIQGEDLRGPAPTPTPSPSASSTPKAEVTTQSGYTMADKVIQLKHLRATFLDH